MKILFAVTTYNQLNYTKKFVKTFKEVSIPGLDLIFVDDVSKDGTQQFLKEHKHTLFERSEPKGLTFSWNIAYRKFKKGKYDVLILANNDILISEGAIKNLLTATKTHSLVCPLSTKKGAGHNCGAQGIQTHYPNLVGMAQRPRNYKKVQSKIKYGCKKMGRFNGFLFAMSRNIIKYEWDKDNLFNPGKVNVHQEGDLGGRMKNKENPVVCLGSFVFHFKGVSFPGPGRHQGKDARQFLKLYH